MQPKTLLQVLFLLLLSLPALTQDKNPFKSIGKKGKILTLSNGKYDEFFDKDSLERVGSVVINRYTRKIERFLNETSLSNEGLKNTDQSRFLSVDPLASSFPEYSPYQFAANSPIRAIDLDGLEDYVVTKELFRSGATKKITIQYATTKNDNQALINAHFREALGKNSDGSYKAGDYLTDQKVIRIVVDANGHETGLPDAKLTKEEQAIVDRRSQVEADLDPTDNQWSLTIGKKIYRSETARNADKMTDKIAEHKFSGNVPIFNGTALRPGSVVSNFNGSNNYFYGGSSLPNGGQLGNDLTASLNILADQLKNADNVKSVTLNLNQGINADVGSQEYNTAQQYGRTALNNAANLLRARLKGSNININIGNVNTTPNATNANLKASGSAGVSATIQ